tara:strand:+ start:2044 stop:3669 length:1626 start_codon:yes stop_codon:yes gene_type:complete
MLLTDNFLFFVFKFFLFFVLFFLIGRGFLILFTKIKNVDNLKIAGLNLYIFYPVLGIIIFGNFLFLLNFFLPINTLFTLLIFLLLIPNLLIAPTYKLFKKSFRNFFLYLILLIPSYDLSYHYDAGLYHLNYQALLRENNIIFGISNIYGPYGIGSIYDYISAALWVDTTFVLLQFVNLIFIILFYEFLFNILFTKNNKLLNSAGLALLIFSIIDNFGYGGGRNGFLYIQSLGKQDVALAVLYFITAILIFLCLSQKEYNSYDIFIPALFSLFILQIKVSGATILLLYLFYLYKLVKDKRLEASSFFSIFPIIFLGILWSLKSMLQTGCLIYPLEISCVKNLSWFDIAYTQITLESAQMFSIAYDFNSSFSDWILEFLDYEINKVIIFNFIISFLVVYAVFYKKNISTSTKSVSPLVFLLIFNIFFFLYYGPHLRYLIATQLLIVFLIGYLRLPRVILNSGLIYFFVIFSIVSLVRLNSYKSFDLFTHPSHDIPVPELIIYMDRFLPKDGDQCWSVTECSPNLQDYKINNSNFYSKVSIKDA